MIKTSKGDIIWNYAGSMFNLGMSLFILPFVLSILNQEEIGLWYIFGSIAALVSLLDFGFSPSIMRNILYAWNGAKTLYKEGIPENFENTTPNISLMLTLIQASKRIYLIIASLAAIILTFFGTIYVSTLIETNKLEYLVSWLIYIAGVCINLYYNYWNPLLKGVGAIKAANQVQVFSKTVYMILTIVGLFLGGGLIWLSVMYLVSGLILNVFSKYIFDKILKIDNQGNELGYSTNTLRILKTIWPNAKKQGLVTIGAWLITRSSTLLSSHFFGLTVTAELGLTIQLYTFVGGFSSLLYNSYIPEITSSKLREDSSRFKTIFSRAILIQWFVGIVGILSIVFIAPLGLKLIGSNSTLLPRVPLLILGIILFLEWNHSTFAHLITLSNRVPFLVPSLISGISIVVLSFLSAMFTNLGVLGLILSQGVIQLLYNNWVWPRRVCVENDLSIYRLIKIGVHDIYQLSNKH